MKNIILLSLLSVFVLSCANEQTVPVYDDIAPKILSVNASNSVWNQDNNTYIKDISLRVYQPEEYPISITLCFLQNPTGMVVDRVGKITAPEYERMGFSNPRVYFCNTFIL